MFGKTDMKKNKGFTLVELIVVLVILAILSAVLVPVLTGYIEQARSKKDLRNAKALMEATQAAFVELYAINPDVKPGEQIVPNEKSFVKDANGNNVPNGNGDQDLSSSKFAKDILKLVDFPKDKKCEYTKPYIFFVAAGSNASGSTMEQYDKFTLYYAMYMETKDSKPWYYYNGEWTTVNPTKGTKVIDNGKGKMNEVLSGPLKGKQLQYYIIVNNSKISAMSGGFWTYLRNLSD